MPKAITVEMLEAMSPDERKTLHHNALARKTPAAQEIIDMLTARDFVAAAKVAAKPRAAKVKTSRATAVKHGRQS